MSAKTNEPRNLGKHGVVCVMGVGNAGGAMLSGLTEQKTPSVRYVMVNAHTHALARHSEAETILIGRNVTKNMGTGANPSAGKKAALESADDIADSLRDVTTLIILCGLGGGTGSGALPIIASLARRMGIFTITLVTLPFYFEGKKRSLMAVETLKSLASNTDCCIAVDSNCFLSPAPKDDSKKTFMDLLAKMNEVVQNASATLISCLEETGVKFGGCASCQSFVLPLYESMFSSFGVEAPFVVIEIGGNPDSTIIQKANHLSMLSPLLPSFTICRHITQQEKFSQCCHFLVHFTAKSVQVTFPQVEPVPYSAFDDFVFDGDHVVLQRNTGGPYSSDIWFSTPLPPKERQFSKKETAAGTRAKVLRFPRHANGKEK